MQKGEGGLRLVDYHLMKATWQVLTFMREGEHHCSTALEVNFSEDAFFR